jgi:hypothetical protein
VEQPVYPQVRFILEKAPGAATTRQDLERLAATALSGMPLDAFRADVRQWLATARHPRWQRPYTELTYQPMQELLRYLRAHGYKTYLVTGGGQGWPLLTKEPRLLLNDKDAGKPEGVQLMIGRRPTAAFGNSTGDRQMLESTAPATARAGRCSCCTMTPAASVPTARPWGCRTPGWDGSPTQELHDQARRQGWIVISIRNDWRRLFSCDP